MKKRITRFCRMNFYVELYNTPPHQIEWFKNVLNSVIRGTCAAATPVTSCGNLSYTTLRWYSEKLPANEIRRIAFGIWSTLVEYKIDDRSFRIEIVMGEWPSVDDDNSVPF